MIKLAPETVVLRWGHRVRDVRVTAHVALTARALGAKGLILSDVQDFSLQSTVMDVVKSWGGQFSIQVGKPWKEAVQEWRRSGGIVIHLTMYGENIETSNVMERIRKASRNILLLVGSQKVPREFYSSSISDFNVAIGDQPHSEVAALAIFLDRLYRGEELNQVYDDAKLHITPSIRGKKIIKNRGIALRPVETEV
jgi:tRNA (cytidine56-2'-O)-methyltransferase